MPCRQHALTRPRIMLKLCIFIMLISASLVLADDKPAKVELKGDPYPLDTCVMSGGKLGSMGKPVVKQYDGREVRFCCAGCIEGFESDKAALLKKLDDKIIEQQMRHYPLTTCVVKEEDELDSENETQIKLVYRNRLVRMCCEGCLDEFHANPGHYIAKLDAAVVKQQKAIYPLSTCPVSGEKLGENAVDHVVGVSLIRFCCESCVAKFHENPVPVMAKVHEAWRAKHSTGNDNHH